MKAYLLKVSALMCLLLLLSVSGWSYAKNGNPSQKSNNRNDARKTDRKSNTKSTAAVTKLPLFFEENKGQADVGVRFLARSRDYNILLSAHQTSFYMPDGKCRKSGREAAAVSPKPSKKDSKPCQSIGLQMRMLNANRDVLVSGADELEAKTDYYIGADESRWQRGISNFKEVRYQNLYQGISAVFRGAEQNLEYDFIVAPGADPNLIKLEFDGMRKIKIDKNGDLIFKFGGAELRHRQPVAYQMIDGERREVSARFILSDKNKIAFRLGSYDKSRELIIDPLVYASFLGGTAGGDVVDDIDVDSAGNIYTASDARFNFPQPDGAIYTYSNILIAKFNPSGNSALYFKYIGGSHDDVPYGMDVDPDGKVVVTGITYSPDFPLHFAEQSTHPITQLDIDYTGFFIRLYADGDIQHSTYMGGNCPDEYGESVVADQDGNAYVTGYTCSSNFATHNGFQNSLQGDYNAFLLRYDGFGHISYGTLFGTDDVYGVDVYNDNSGYTYITGGVYAGSVHTTPGAYSTTGTGFVAKFNTNATGAQSLVFSTRIPKFAAAIAVDGSGNSWVSMSRQGVATYDAAQIIKLNNSGTQLLVSPMYYGNAVRDIAVDAIGSAYFAANHYNFNGTEGVTTIFGLRPDGTEIDSVEIDATRSEATFGVALGPIPDIVYICGRTNSLDFPTSPAAYQPASNSFNNFGQGFFGKVEMQTGERNPLIFVPGVGGSTLYEADSNGNPVTNLWMDGILSNYYNNKLEKLSLNPADAPFPNVAAVDVTREFTLLGYPVQKIYGPLLEKLVNDGGYVEYDIQNNPKKRNVDCTGQYTGNKPSLFVFAYDWRKSNTESAIELKKFVGCVAKFYPNQKVDILTHSMGGLVARSYILNNQSTHNVYKLITTVAPWFGAPKAIDSTFSGRFIGEFDRYYGGVYLHQQAVKNIIQFGKGPHELYPSGAYWIVGGQPIAHQESRDSQPKNLNYAEALDFMNTRFSNQPYTNNADFHNKPGQDNWSADTTGIKYYHLYGVQNCESTIGKVTVAPRTSRPLSLSKLRFGTELSYTKGDGTVPEISAHRPASMLAQTTVMQALWRPAVDSSDCSQDESYSHNGILSNIPFQDELINILGRNSSSSAPRPANSPDDTMSKPVNSNLGGGGGEGMVYLDVAGVNRLDIFDDAGRTNTPLTDVADKSVPGIGYQYGSPASSSLVIPHNVTFLDGKVVDIKFTTVNEDINISVLKGVSQSNATTSIKYLDLNLPVGVRVWLRFSATAVENLRYDADGDGTFETEVQPNVNLTGAAAKDRTAPNLTVSYNISNNVATVTANATDAESGLKEIRYIINGAIADNVYAAPFTVDLSASQLVYVSAEDNAGNRTLQGKWLDLNAPVTTFNQTPPANAGGWNTSDITAEIKAIDNVGASGVESLTFTATGAQPSAEQTLSRKDPPLTFPQPSTANDNLTKTFNFFTEGVTTLTFSAKDKAGNIEATKSQDIKIDKSSPITHHSSSSDGQQTTFTLTAADAVSGVGEIVYSIDGGAAQIYSAPFSVSNTGGHYVSFFARDVAGNEETARTVYINPGQVPKSVLISEFRTRGYNGADDEFIELYNNGESAVDISGWTISVKQGSITTPLTLATINSGAVIPPRGHYLLRKDGTSNYSLSAYAEADQTYTGALADNIGIKLLSDSSAAIDAVGFSGVTDASYREGTALAPSSGISTNGQYSFVRNYLRALPVDSNNNRADFLFVATDAATYNNLKAILGSPGPENLSSPIYREGDVLIAQIDDKVTLAEAPNRLYDYTAGTTQYPIGMLSVRRKLTNNTGSSITALKLRITGITTKNSAAIFPQQAVLRSINSADITVTSLDGLRTYPLKGLTIESVPTTVDAGLNSTLTFNLGAGLANGESVNVDLKSGIVVNGLYRLEFRVEAIASTP